MEAKIVWSPEFLASVDQTFGEGGELQKFVDSAILESIEPYMPRDTGMTIASGKLNTLIGSGLLIWKNPQVKMLYYGMLMIDPVTGSPRARKGVKKIPTDTPLKFQGGGKRGSLWAERWMQDNLVKFEADLQKEADALLRR